MEWLDKWLNNHPCEQERTQPQVTEPKSQPTFSGTDWELHPCQFPSEGLTPAHINNTWHCPEPGCGRMWVLLAMNYSPKRDQYTLRWEEAFREPSDAEIEQFMEDNGGLA